VGWGYQPERIQARIYILLYTLFWRIPILLLIILTIFIYREIEILLIIKRTRLFYMLIFIIPFLIKLPLYFFHLWLPKAHVEAPTLGRILLAGVLLKLGGYGSMLLVCLLKINIIKTIIWLLGGLITLNILVIIIQRDQKAFIAYSSIVHITLMWLVILSITNLSIIASTYLIIFHGLVSSNLFIISGFIFKEGWSRIIFKTQNINYELNIIIICTFLLNIGIPPFLGILVEINIRIILVFILKIFIAVLCIIIIIFSIFTIFIIISLRHGKHISFYLNTTPINFIVLVLIQRIFLIYLLNIM